MYSEQVMEHFRNHRNVGGIENPDGIGYVGNAVCGDVMELYIRVKGIIVMLNLRPLAVAQPLRPAAWSPNW